MPMYDIQTILQAGITPSKGILKNSNALSRQGERVTPDLIKNDLSYDSMFGIMRHQNMIETLERYQWLDLPPGITQDLIERVLFFRGKGVFYFNDKVDKFQFLPFALNGLIDEYGRYLRVNTLPFTGVTEKEEEDEKKKPKSYVYEDLEIVYDLPYTKEMLEDIASMKIRGIILNDNSLSISQNPVIRNNFVRPVLSMMSSLMMIIHTAMYGAADHSVIQVQDEGQLDTINVGIQKINQDILHGKRFTVVSGALPITPIKTANSGDLEGLFGTFNSLTNFLKSITGIANAGVFDKKAHLLQEEQKLNGSNSDDIYYNGLRLRQEFCMLIQTYYGVKTWCSSKRGMSGAESENYSMGEIDDVDDTQRSRIQDGGDSNAKTDN